ncbi:MAG: hypothetical protein J6C59_04020 [Muribaculaceae bacterium]|nr:hypothetical protein [Muribaculaceae bacterium]
MKRLFFIMILALVCASGFARQVEIKSVPLPAPVGINEESITQSKMSVEGETAYFPTSNGIYSINLTDVGKGWTRQGFEGENLIECARKGDEWLAITRNRGERLLLRSTDNGKTFEDCTPYSFFREPKYRNVARLCQDPENPDVIYMISGYAGILKSTDFGKSWSLVSNVIFENETYCGFEIHPLDSDILLQHGESFIMSPQIQISYNGGKDWIGSYGYPDPDIKIPDISDYSENCIHDIAFHPTDINTWIFGGEGVIAKTSDKGATWDGKGESWGYHYSTLYDSNNPDVIYSLGQNNCDSNREGWLFMVSDDGGETWREQYHHTNLEQPWYNDVKQTEDYLIVFGVENLYFVNKADLLAQSGIQEVENDCSDGNIYSIEGRVVKRNAGKKDLDNLPKGLYIQHGRTVIVK